MTQTGLAVNDGNYSLAADQVASGRWRVDTERGLVFGVRGRPFIRRNTCGYIQIKFRHPDDWTCEVAVLAHRVIWESEHGPMGLGEEINHRNGDKADNQITNLEVVDRLGNVRHARDTGLWQPSVGELHPSARITEADAVTIYRRAWSGETSAAIAADYPIGRSMVGNIKCGLAWAHATGHGR